ncbi:MAG: hypothetical protein GY866_03300 [Proteobacteria bacterium]|nr:hypothetical protein [Pseudomonadota bacterium]
MEMQPNGQTENDPSCPWILQTDEYPETVVFRFSGDVNSSLLNRCGIPAKIDYLLTENKEQFVLDFLETDSVDSSTVGLISRVAKFKKTIKIVCIEHTLVHDVFDTLQLFSVIPRFDTIEDALEKEK